MFFSRDTCIDMVLFSTLAYFDSDHINHNIHESNPAVKFIQSGSAQAMTAQFSDANHNILVISFRETEIPNLSPSPDNQLQFLREWTRNFDITLKSADFLFQTAGPENVHSGWLDGVERLWHRELENVLNLFLQRPGQKKKIFITGHSQGAGIATLAAAKIMTEVQTLNDNTQVALYAIAAPKVGDLAFVHRMNNLVHSHYGSFRLSNHNDPISFMPPFDSYAVGPGTHYHLSNRTYPEGNVMTVDLKKVADEHFFVNDPSLMSFNEIPRVF